ncbi:hypothetical protein SNOG_02888 [Parastagonospora nodorum SN15]|uniref:Uncharacterized protein n=1 Tax=Phaeosphaeria nodorum (strain SN15 / ATCC MYA-4574 / FGSC 10173) TaxID=321614 RepID=Q0UZC6_PHANO|nr:hypothetical protein SNOG_02888 [Parastagonospora nodorum SN15]EAT89619.1 hypothetical protein SNOG_02888 [Parastagonospora nodorum SN15]
MAHHAPGIGEALAVVRKLAATRPPPKKPEEQPPPPA